MNGYYIEPMNRAMIPDTLYADARYAWHAVCAECHRAVMWAQRTEPAMGTYTRTVQEVLACVACGVETPNRVWLTPEQITFTIAAAALARSEGT